MGARDAVLASPSHQARSAHASPDPQRDPHRPHVQPDSARLTQLAEPAAPPSQRVISVALTCSLETHDTPSQGRHSAHASAPRSFLRSRRVQMARSLVARCCFSLAHSMAPCPKRCAGIPQSRTSSIPSSITASLLCNHLPDMKAQFCSL